MSKLYYFINLNNVILEYSHIPESIQAWEKTLSILVNRGDSVTAYCNLDNDNAAKALINTQFPNLAKELKVIRADKNTKLTPTSLIKGIDVPSEALKTKSSFIFVDNNLSFLSEVEKEGYRDIYADYFAVRYGKIFGNLPAIKSIDSETKEVQKKLDEEKLSTKNDKSEVSNQKFSEIKDQPSTEKSNSQNDDTLKTDDKSKKKMSFFFGKLFIKNNNAKGQAIKSTVPNNQSPTSTENNNVPNVEVEKRVTNPLHGIKLPRKAKKPKPQPVNLKKLIPVVVAGQIDEYYKTIIWSDGTVMKRKFKTVTTRDGDTSKEDGDQIIVIKGTQRSLLNYVSEVVMPLFDENRNSIGNHSVPVPVDPAFDENIWNFDMNFDDREKVTLDPVKETATPSNEKEGKEEVNPQKISNIEDVKSQESNNKDDAKPQEQMNKEGVELKGKRVSFLEKPEVHVIQREEDFTPVSSPKMRGQ